MELTLDQALQKGVEAHKVGKVQEADQYYTAILKANPNHPEANHNMGVLAVGVGKAEAALPFFKTALEAKPSIAQFWIGYINALIKLDQMDVARDALEQAKTKGVKANGLEQIEEQLGSSPSKSSNAQEPSQDQLNSLFKLYNQNRLQQVVNEAQTLTKRYTKSLTLWNLIGSSAAQLGQLDEAVNAFQKAISINPDYAKAYYNMGNALRDLGKLDEAVEAYKKALASKPDYAEAYNNMGYIFQQQEKPEEAIEAYNNAISIKPDYADANYNMGNALTEQAKLEEAIEAYNNAISIKPDYAEAYSNMGLAFQHQGKLDEAIEAYNNAISIKPDYAEAYSNMGNALKGQGRLEEAIEAYKKTVSINPNYAEAYNNMGNALKEQNKLEEAIQAYNKAISIKPDYAEAYYNMANTLKEQGKLNKATEAYKKAVSINPNYAEAYNNMGNALKEQDKLEEAIQAYNKALSIKPDFQFAKHILSALTGKTTETAPKEYVEALFDGFSTRFEASLVNNLQYKTPKLVKDIVIKYNPNESLGSVLDLGCGTGLFGSEIRNYCSQLEGVDLSSKMLTLAEKKNVYDKLSHLDIIEYLSSMPLGFDYYISLDVFVYVGDLSEIFRLIKSRNNKPGKLVFSTEHSDRDGYHLLKTGRYSHSKSYIEYLCKKFGYSISHFSTNDLRKENNDILTGGIYVSSFAIK